MRIQGCIGIWGRVQRVYLTFMMKLSIRQSKKCKIEICIQSYHLQPLPPHHPPPPPSLPAINHSPLAWEVGWVWPGRLYIIMHLGEPSDQEGTTMRKLVIVQTAGSPFIEQFELQVPYDSERRELDLAHVLEPLLAHLLPYATHQLFYLHPLHAHYVYAGRLPGPLDLFLGEDFIRCEEIRLRLRRVAEPEVSASAAKRKRVAERSIREVILKVAEWRDISLKDSKVTLEQAAKRVGVPKKTLDDYYAQVKLAEEYGFDFPSNMDLKIGTLRKFVREKHIRRKGTEDLDFLDDLLKGESDEEQE